MSDPTPTEGQQMTEARLDEIEKRANAATPGEWRTQSYVVDAQTGEEVGAWSRGNLAERRRVVLADTSTFIVVELGPAARWADADFIAHARQDVPDLVAEVRRLHEQIGREITQRGMAMAAWGARDGETLYELVKRLFKEREASGAQLAAVTRERDEARKTAEDAVGDANRYATEVSLLRTVIAGRDVERDEAQASAAVMRETLTEFADEICRYGDGCPNNADTRHGRCDPCRARLALSADVARDVLAELRARAEAAEKRLAALAAPQDPNEKCRCGCLSGLHFALEGACRADGCNCEMFLGSGVLAKPPEGA